jgi:hypothetical protein
MIRSCLVFLFVFVFIPLLAQVDYRKGYIIKNNGDSLSGLVAYPTIKKSHLICYYKFDKGSKSEKFSPEELVAYGIFGDKRFESKRVFVEGVSTLSFLEVLVKGDLSLYGMGYIFYYERDTLMELPSVKRSGTSYVGVLNLLLNECNLRADDTKYEQRDLINLVQNYNRCLSEAGFVFKATLPWTRFNYQLLGGVTYSNMRMENFGNISFNPSTGAFLGAGTEISLPRLNEKIFYSIELNYYKSLFQGYREILQPMSFRSDLVINMSLLRVPLGVRYNFFSDYNSPYIKGGAVGGFNVGSTYNYITEIESSGSVTTTVSSGKLQTKAQIGFWMSAGYQRAVTGRYKLFIEARFEKMYGYLYGNFQSPIDNHNLNILLGLRY